MLETLWDLIWFMVVVFFMITYFMALFAVFGDLFRSDKSGVAKAGWLIFIFILPLLGLLVYLIANGGKMQERAVSAAEADKAAMDAYIREAAGASPADQIARAKGLLDSGAITQDEFAALKAKALG